MPIQGQIIPSLLQPHVETYINDNTVFTEQTVPVEDGIKTICVFTSDQGRDNKIMLMRSLTEYVEEFGQPNFKSHGQPCLMPYGFLSSENANVYCMRVLPEDATYACTILCAEVNIINKEVSDKEEESRNGKKTIKCMKIKHCVKNVSASKPEELVAVMSKLLENAENSHVYPLMAFYCKGRGNYGNALRVRLSSDITSDKQNSYKNFAVEVLDSRNGLTLKETFARLSLDEDVIVRNVPMFMEDVLNDEDTGSSKIGVKVCTDSILELLEKHNKECDGQLTSSIFDPLFGKTKTNQQIETIKIEPATVETRDVVVDVDDITYVNLSEIEGLALANGTDGEFALGTPQRQDNIDKVLISAFNGKIDRSILSKKRTPAEIILDACYSDEVKNALIGLINKREDAYGVIDGCIINSGSDLMEWAKEKNSRGSRLFSKEAQHYYMRDPITGKKIAVTTTYFLATKLPTHFKQVGRNIPFVGEEYAKLSGHIKNTLLPVVDADDTELKEILVDNRVNYYESIGENIFIRGCQHTSQPIWSDLSEEHNVHVLLKMKREIENMVSSLAYNFSEPEDRKLFTESADRLLSQYRGMCQSTKVRFEATQFEEQRSAIHCYLDVVFKGIIKSGIIEIDINPRA